MKERKTATKMFASNYQQASKKWKMELLDEFEILTADPDWSERQLQEAIQTLDAGKARPA